MTLSTNDLKINIINLITKIDDVNKLQNIYKNVEQQVSRPILNNTMAKKKLDFRDAIVEITEGVSYQQILEEQNYKPITYQEFRALADEIEWEHTLDELLAALD